MASSVPRHAQSRCKATATPFKVTSLILLFLVAVTSLRCIWTYCGSDRPTPAIQISLHIINDRDPDYVPDTAPTLQEASPPMLQTQRAGAALPTPAFRALNDGGVLTFDGVCIEAASGATNALMEEAGKMTRRIVVYGGSQNQAKFGQHNISVSGSPNVPHDQWTIHFAGGSIPPTHRLLDNSVAYFVSPTSCPGDLHRFWVEEFLGLWSVVSRTGRLFPGAQNRILYSRQRQQLTEYEMRCRSVKRYDEFLQSLYTSSPHEAYYWMTPINTCFAHGVFGARFSGTTERDVIGHVRRHVLGDDYNLTVARDYDVTIIERRRRRILNVEQLATAARQANFSNVRVVDLDSLSVAEQTRVAAESCVMVGVTGSELQWASFMPNGLWTVVEIAWPARHWNFWYDFLPLYGLQRLQLTVDPTHVRLNWTSYEFEVLNGRQTNDTERQQILASPSAAAAELWKWADVVVNVTEFVDLLSVHCHCEDYFKPAFSHIED